jgi:hypothetical protein
MPIPDLLQQLDDRPLGLHSGRSTRWLSEAFCCVEYLGMRWWHWTCSAHNFGFRPAKVRVMAADGWKLQKMWREHVKMCQF